MHTYASEYQKYHVRSSSITTLLKQTVQEHLHDKERAMQSIKDLQSDERLLELPLTELVTIGEAARDVGRDRQTIHQWLRKGLIRGIQVSGTGLWMVSLAEVQEVAAAARPLAERIAEQRADVNG